jgi:Protein of unknown function (DUF2541)
MNCTHLKSRIMKRVISLFVVAVVIMQVQLLFAQTASIAPTERVDDWLLLGTHAVDYTLDRDVISLKERKNVEALKLVVKNGTLNMHKCTVHFTDGETKSIEISQEVNQANDGVIMDLKGSNRSVEKVTFWYDTKNSSDKKSVIEVWGRS